MGKIPVTSAAVMRHSPGFIKTVGRGRAGGHTDDMGQVMN